MKKLGIVANLLAVPIYYKLKESADTFELVANSNPENVKLLREDKLDAAFLSPIEYARHFNIFSVIPNIAVSSEGFSKTISLFFKEGLKEIKSIATDLKNPSEMVLAKIVMLEKYDINPQFIQQTGNLNDMLEKADSALIIGEPNLSSLKEFQNKLDLVDEWYDITELPFVHGFWISREGKLTPGEIELIQKSASYGASHLTEIAALFRDYQTDELVEYLSAFHYELNSRTESGLSEYLRMAYYHHIIDDLPEIKFLKENGKTLSLN
jgi:chorismate dehydratase